MSDKNLKLSQLIRLGASQTKQATAQLVDDDGATCAIGAAYLARFGELPPPLRSDEALSRIGFDPLQFVTAPPLPNVECCRYFNQLHRVIIWLNDQCQWPREKIADYLESIGM